MHSAAYIGDIPAVQNYLNKGVDVKEKNSALGFAAEGGHIEIVKLLIDKGADVNVINPYYSVLGLAVMGGHIEIVKLLIDKGADVNAMNANFSANYPKVPFNVLIYAATIADKDNGKIVKLLMEKGVKGADWEREALLTSEAGIIISSIDEKEVIDGKAVDYISPGLNPIIIPPGPHILTVKYRTSTAKGSPIVIRFNAKAGKIYIIRRKISERFFGGTWNAWIDEYP